MMRLVYFGFTTNMASENEFGTWLMFDETVNV